MDAERIRPEGVFCNGVLDSRTAVKVRLMTHYAAYLWG